MEHTTCLEFQEAAKTEYQKSWGFLVLQNRPTVALFPNQVITFVMMKIGAHGTFAQLVRKLIQYRNPMKSGSIQRT